MANDDGIVLHGKANDSLTIRHIEQSAEKALTTAHLRQRIEHANQVQSQGNSGGTASGSGSGQQQGSGDKK